MTSFLKVFVIVSIDENDKSNVQITTPFSICHNSNRSHWHG